MANFIEWSILLGADGFSTATGVLNSASADGTFTWTLEQPSSPEYLTQLRGGFRVQSISSDGLGTVEDGWEWQLEYQTDDTWTFSWYSVTSGTAASAILTQTNIGTVTNVRVTLNGNSISVETSANNGSSYTARGNTSSATYATTSGLCSSYTGATGPQLQPNGDLTNWIGGLPFGYGTVLGGGQVTEVGSGQLFGGGGSGSMNLYNDGTGTERRPSAIDFSPPTIASKTYLYLQFISAMAATSRALLIPVIAGVGPATAPGLYASRAAGNIPYGARLESSTLATPFGNITYDYFYIYEIAALDDSGDGGFTEVAS